MRFITGCFLIAAMVFSVSAQDGIYGSFLVGQKFIDLDPLNDVIKDVWGYDGNEFPNNRWTFGGEGHLILAKRLVLGGRAFGIFDNRPWEQKADPTKPDFIKLTAGMGVANIGFNLLPENRFGMRLYPMVGAGVSSFIFQAKTYIDNTISTEDNFNDILLNNNDYMITLGKIGFITDISAGFDWYKPFKNFFTIIPGLDFGLMFHFEAGYSFLPINLQWRRDIDLGGEGQIYDGPDLQFSGLYLNAGFGLGLTPR
ncbi:MAG: hypothetical protein GF401_00535 [Chitinivibrionales bacterium]|nr:hypothetical protein [Chitinivibrionales bacterium]